jgi:hypothetical protein
MVAVFVRTATSDFRKVQKKIESCMPLVKVSAYKMYLEVDNKTINSDRLRLSQLLLTMKNGLVNKDYLLYRQSHLPKSC